MRTSSLALAVASALALVAPAARGEEPPPARPLRTAPREAPQLEGRPPPATTTGEALLWVPRVALFPAYVITDYGIRRPVGWLMFQSEKGRLPAFLIDLITFGDEGQAILTPTFFVDFGMRPSVGLYYRHRDLLGRGNTLRVSGGTWGPDWLHGVVSDEQKLYGYVRLRARAEVIRRADWFFAGIGYDSRAEHVTRYAADDVNASVSLDWLSPRHDRWVNVSFGMRHLATRAKDGCCGHTGVVEGASYGFFPIPPGLPGNYTTVRQRIDLAYDTRDSEAPSGSGFRVEGYASPAWDVRAPTERAWFHWGAAAGASLNLTGQRRVVTLSMAADFTERLGRDPVPFTELQDARTTMRGYLPGRLHGASSVAWTLEYRWPIWVWLDGATHVALGNVFGPHLAGFDVDRLRASFGLGLRSTGRPDQQFEITVAAGSEPFDLGGRITSGRFVIGASPRF